MMGLGPNRVLDSAARMRDRIERRVKPDGSPITADLDAFERDQALTFGEWFAYQEAQARAHAMGKITTDEASTIYTALGGEAMPTDGWADGVDLALKVTITQVMGELLAVAR
jgi:hypothetical protein